MITLTRPVPAPSYAEFTRLFKQVNVGRTQFEVGELIGVTQSYAGQLLRGRARPSRELLDRIVSAYPEIPEAQWLHSAGFGKEPPPDEMELMADKVAERVAKLLQPEENHRDLFWRLYGERVDVLEAEGIEAVLPTFNDRGGAAWDELSRDDIEAMVDQLERRSRERHTERQGRTSPEG